MFPRSEYRQIWDRLAEKLPEREVCEAQLATVLADLL